MTNTNLIPVFNGQIANQSIQCCNAQELHAFLEVQSKFADWIKNRITEYGFIENEDYIITTERTNGRPRKEYHITLEMGKELGMVERNAKGRQIRQYFIACEKQAKGEQTAVKIAPLSKQHQQNIKELVMGRAKSLPKDQQARATI
ncbi:antA/AntB antirepressor family protein, partial [Lonepinella koalarum]|uniref:antA/AntB antirepressor family protein n=1 Tax=Lonepinella koalarum TaxID=53417 RepID=UPI003F6DF0A3